MLAQMLIAAPRQSAAFDEGYTLTYGYAYLRGGDARLSRGQNPPLTNVFLALPLLLRNDVAFPLDHPTWQMPTSTASPMNFCGRPMSIARRNWCCWRVCQDGVALHWPVQCMPSSIVVQWHGALIALFLCVFDPNILAHGYIAGTDLGVTLFLFSAVWVWTVALKHSSLRYASIAGLLAGAALATKYSAMWLVPILLVITLAYPGLRDRWKSRSRC
jgi:hypothetical protein